MTTRYFNETIGLCDVLDNDKVNKRLCFFEIDVEDPEIISRIKQTYRIFNLDHMIHRTKKGYHFLSPTIVPRTVWKKFHDQLKDINSDCPMVCMRIKGNKYPNEDIFFYKSWTDQITNGENNSRDLCNLLNEIFGTSFIGRAKGNIKLVRYKPHVEVEQ